MLFSAPRKNLDRATLKLLGGNKMLVWQLKNYWMIAVFMNVILPPLLGFMFFGTLKAAVAFYIFIGLGRAIQQHATFCVNSACHFLGSKNYMDGTPGDIGWMAIFLLGENWHNFHHAFPRDYRNGCKWYHFDVHKWIIYIMSKIGLASDLVITPEHRISVKSKEVMESIYLSLCEKLTYLKEESEKLSVFAAKKIQLIERAASSALKKGSDGMYTKLLSIEKSAKMIALKAEEAMRNSTKIKGDLVNTLSVELGKLHVIFNTYCAVES